MNRVLWPSVLLALLVTITGASACTSILGGFEVGSGGTGGTGSGGATSSGGTSSTGGCETQQCCIDSECPATGSECLLPHCDDGTCGTANTPEGTLVSRQTPNDCQEIRCDGQGAAIAVALDGDTMDDGLECTADSCAEGAPLHTALALGLPCPSTPGKLCNGAGACVECNQPNDCLSGVCGAEGSCLAATCDDGVTNGDETDVDCGGACNGCDTGQTCVLATDCYHGICDAGGTCVGPTCGDGVKNGGDYLANDGETDVDCGGPCGSTCGPLAACNVDADCFGGACSGSLCLANCVDGVKNNLESDVDCGGGTCAPCDAGLLCGAGADCASTFCTDGVCCDSACDATCVACTAALKNSGSDGVCGPIEAGTDPQNECDPEAPATCGNSTGFCSGALGCAKHPANTPCGDPPSCAAGQQTNQDTCSGAGTCTNNGTTSCGLYACGMTACNTLCSVAADCAAAAYCPAGTCVTKKAGGAACAGPGECASGFCTDGVCCNTACGALCTACASALTGTASGTCANVTSATDPGNECVGTTNCNGAGACTKLATGTACTQNAECTSNFCVDGFCCNTSCTGACSACSAAKRGSGVNGTCGTIAANTDPDSECATECNGAGACEVTNGTACASNAICQSGFCADGVCCGSACTSLCQACTLAKTGTASGTCANILNATDPESECVGATNCNGAGACTKLATGTSCTQPTECSSGFCADGFCCGTGCTFTCTACRMTKTGQPNGTCANITGGTDPDTECVNATNCNGSGQCGLFANGVACTVAAECTSGFCADGVCCNTACPGLCRACTAAKTGGANGTCANVSAGTDPDNECSTAGALNCAAGAVCGP